MGKDLGTYFVRATLYDGKGWIQRINTAYRFCYGTEEDSPLDASVIKPPWSSEDELISTMESMYSEGNYSCDCNRSLFLARAYQQPEPIETLCRETIRIKKFEILNPALEVVYNEDPFEEPFCEELTDKLGDKKGS